MAIALERSASAFPLVRAGGAGGVRTHDLTDLRSAVLPGFVGLGGDVLSLATPDIGCCGVTP